MAAHKIGKFVFKFDKEGFHYIWGDNPAKHISFGRKNDAPQDDDRYQGDDSDYAYGEGQGYYDGPAGDGYDDGYYYDDDQQPYADGDDGYYADGQDGEPPAGPVMEFLENNLWALIALLVVLPPLGIYLLWRFQRFDFMPRVIASAVSAIWFIVVLILIFNAIFSGSDDSSTPPSMTLTSFAPTSAPTTSAPLPTPSATPASTDEDGAPVAPSATPIGGGVTSGTAAGDAAADSSNVYSPQTGLYYHKSANCTKIDSNVSVTLVTVEAAKNRNQSACPLCCGGTVYYATTGGSRYHTNSNCDGMTGAVEYSKEAAEREGKVACYICAGGTQPSGASDDNQSTAQRYAASITNDRSGIKVWMTSGGSAYHASATCRGMSGASEVTLLRALQSGKPACTECLAYLNSYVYCTSGGTYYHSAATTCGMKNGTRVTLSAALVLGKKRCADCIDEQLYSNPSSTQQPGDSSGSGNELMVYATANGSYYHTDPTCGGMNNPPQVTLSAALKAGRPACPVCCPSAEKTVYASSESRYYHSYAGCGGMTNATSGTLAQALTYNLTACRDCWSSTGEAVQNTEDGNTGYSGIYVYATETGGSYHASKSCSEMTGTEVRVLLEQAIDDGKSPCSTCADYADDRVYAAEGNRYFHKTNSCSGILNPVRGTVVEALLYGLKACPICFTEEDMPNQGQTTSTFISGKSGIDVYGTYSGRYYHMNMLCTGISGTPIKVSLETALNNSKSACPVCASSADRTVYGAPDGRYYHYSSGCAGDSATSGNLDTALALGLKACPNCVTGSTDVPDEFVEGTSGINVYAMATGRYYHTRSSCGDMIEGQRITLEKALNLGFEACPTCAEVAGRKVYAQSGGTIYHLDSSCAGDGYISGTLDVALAYGFTACPVCVKGEDSGDDVITEDITGNIGAGDSSAPASTRVYIDLTGGSSAFLYHAGEDCSDSSMSDGTAVTLEYALNHGYTDCGYCFPPTNVE